MYSKLLLMSFFSLNIRNLSMIQKDYLGNKNLREIKNRYKNLIRKKSPENIIKSWKTLQFAPLTELETSNMTKALYWFNEENWTRISKYFLVGRSPTFLNE